MPLATTTHGRLTLPDAPGEWPAFVRSLPDARLDGGRWTAEATPSACWRVAEALGPSQCDDAIRGLAEPFGRAIDTAHRSLGEEHGQPPIQPKLDLWAHQLRAFWFAYPMQAVLLAMWMGCGKSAVALSLILNWRCKNVLILCPTSVRSVWRREIERHYPGTPNTLILDRGTVAHRTKQADQAWRRQGYGMFPGPLIVVLNYEAAWREPMASWLLGRRWDCVILDESHIIKADDSKISRFCAQISPQADHRLCLTGTPLAQTPLDAWGQFRFLDPGLFGTSHRAFLARYEAPDGEVKLRNRIAAVNDRIAAMLSMMPAHEHEEYRINLPPTCLTGLRNEDELRERIALITYYCHADDVLDLPPLLHDERICELGPEGRRIYDAIEGRLVADIGQGTVTASDHLTRLTRLQQCSSGFLPDDKTHTIHRVDDAKASLLLELMTEAGGEPVVVFCRYRHDLDRVQEAARLLGLRYGELSHVRKDATTDRGEMKADLEVVGVQPKSGGLGIDLTRARIAIFYSLSFSLSEYDQAVARVHRPGQTRPTIIYSLVCENTIDRRIHTAIQGRREVVAEVMRQLSESQTSPMLSCVT